MNLQEFKQEYPNYQNSVWICDYRFNDYSKKPIRHVKPTEVNIRNISTLPKGKHIYYSDIYFSPINKNTIIAPYDTTGFRSYTGVSLQIFITKDECLAYYRKICTAIIESLENESKLVVDKLNERIQTIKLEIGNLE